MGSLESLAREREKKEKEGRRELDLCLPFPPWVLASELLTPEEREWDGRGSQRVDQRGLLDGFVREWEWTLGGKRG